MSWDRVYSEYCYSHPNCVKRIHSGTDTVEHVDVTPIKKKKKTKKKPGRKK